jgi:hypothetical protein
MPRMPPALAATAPAVVARVLPLGPVPVEHAKERHLRVVAEGLQRDEGVLVGLDRGLRGPALLRETPAQAERSARGSKNVACAGSTMRRDGGEAQRE